MSNFWKDEANQHWDTILELNREIGGLQWEIKNLQRQLKESKSNNKGLHRQSTSQTVFPRSESLDTDLQYPL